MADESSLDEVTFAVIGDYGSDNSNEFAVANLVKEQFSPDFIVTVGDNVYGSTRTLDNAVGKYYSDYIGNYQGDYGTGTEDVNRFFPALGNHDWEDGGGLQAYLDYFTLPGNERYYQFTQGPVQFFILDSYPDEPDGNTADSVQAQWLRRGLQNSTAEWQIVVMHDPPYSSGDHAPEEDMRWPFEEWGVDAVLSGHDHVYERLLKDGNGDGTVVPYFVNGLGGASRYPFSNDVDPDSAFRYNENYGAMLVHATNSEITFEFRSVSNELIDTYIIVNSIGRADMFLGTSAADVFDGGAGNDILKGRKGDDSLLGGGGNDRLVGGAGSDVLTGGTGDDSLKGKRGNDALLGGDGTDRLLGGSGRDELTGGAGDDVFTFSRGHDTITDFEDGLAGDDVVELSASLWGGQVLTTNQILAFAHVEDGDIVFDFDDGNTLRLEGKTNIAALAGDLVVL